jgi:hypothetical protein
MEPTTLGPAPAGSVRIYRSCRSGGHRSRLFVGLLLIGLGAVFALAAYGVVDLYPLSRLWPAFLIVAGAAITFRSRGRRIGGLVLLFLGIGFLLRNLGALPFDHRLFPAAVLFLIGLSFVLASLAPRRRFAGRDGEPVEGGSDPGDRS